MGRLKQFAVDDETIDILKKGKIENNVYYLPNIQLERSLYDKVNKVLNALGSKWSRKQQGHIFEYDIANSLEETIKTKSVTDWKKATDFFYTPENVALNMLELVPHGCYESLTVIDPSAGQGHLLDVAKQNFCNAKFMCVENNPLHCEVLKKKGYSPINADFLTVSPFDVDLVLMNPPFTYECEHIQHAYKFLKQENACLVTIASSTILNKSTIKKYREFKEWLDSVNGYDYGLPQNSFKDAGTSTNTTMLVFST